MANIELLMLASGKSYHATRWANALADAGLSITFVTIHKVVRPISSSVNIIELPSVGKMSYALASGKARRLVRDIAPDLVHSHSAGGYGLLGLLARGSRPWVLSVYGADVYDVPKHSPAHKAVVGGLLARADQLLSTSHAMADHVCSLYPRLPRPIVTPFGVDIEHFAPPSSPPNKRDVITIGIVKKLERKYGVDVLLRAFDQVADRYGRSVQLRIVGEGSEKAALMSMRNRSKWAEQIHFHGAIPNADVPAFLHSCDIFVVPSRYESESFGVAAVEASAAGLPVIVSDVGGLPEVIDHERTGLIVRREDSDVLAKAISRLIDNPDERGKLGAAGRTKVEELYDWRANVSQMIGIYETMLVRAGQNK